MEIEGIYYYFKHEDGKHTLMLVDNMRRCSRAPTRDSIRYEHQMGPGEYRTEDTIFSADMHKVVKPNVYENNDYNFRIPTNKLKDWQKVQRDTGLSIDVSRRFYPANVEIARGTRRITPNCASRSRSTIIPFRRAPVMPAP